MTATDARAPERLAALWARLATVVDPELDELVTELRFVTAVEMDAEGRVRIHFRLPTYWCAANFAFLMADDLRRAALSLPWVRSVAVELDEHMYGEAINRGLAEGRSFKETFGDEAEGQDLEALRLTFRRKAFQGRQERMIEALAAGGWSDAAMLELTGADLAALALETAEAAVARERYLEIRGEIGGPGILAFVTVDGEPIAPAAFKAYRNRLRSARLNIEFNGLICRGLLRARYDDPAPPGEPTLYDFVREAAAQTAR